MTQGEIRKLGRDAVATELGPEIWAAPVFPGREIRSFFWELKANISRSVNLTLTQALRWAVFPFGKLSWHKHGRGARPAPPCPDYMYGCAHPWCDCDAAD